jgi:hypothetical protein
MSCDTHRVCWAPDEGVSFRKLSKLHNQQIHMECCAFQGKPELHKWTRDTFSQGGLFTIAATSAECSILALLIRGWGACCWLVAGRRGSPPIRMKARCPLPAYRVQPFRVGADLCRACLTPGRSADTNGREIQATEHMRQDTEELCIVVNAERNGRLSDHNSHMMTTHAKIMGKGLFSERMKYPFRETTISSLSCLKIASCLNRDSRQLTIQLFRLIKTIAELTLSGHGCKHTAESDAEAFHKPSCEGPFRNLS